MSTQHLNGKQMSYHESPSQGHTTSQTVRPLTQPPWVCRYFSGKAVTKYQRSTKTWYTELDTCYKEQCTRSVTRRAVQNPITQPPPGERGRVAGRRSLPTVCIPNTRKGPLGRERQSRWDTDRRNRLAMHTWIGNHSSTLVNVVWCAHEHTSSK